VDLATKLSLATIPLKINFRIVKSFYLQFANIKVFNLLKYLKKQKTAESILQESLLMKKKSIARKFPDVLLVAIYTIGVSKINPYVLTVPFSVYSIVASYVQEF